MPVTISADASKFQHRRQLVSLPPAWFAHTPPPRLPTVMMIGAELNTPVDWLRAGNAVNTVDDFASAHGGNAPVLVFVDPTGAFNNDTECVNGSRGNAGITDERCSPVHSLELRRQLRSGQLGHRRWSMGGTRAVDLTVRHPEMFSAFVDIASYVSPNSGNREQTIARLFDGNP